MSGILQLKFAALEGHVEISNEVLIAAIALTASLIGGIYSFAMWAISRGRINQEALLHRESHNLELFRSLASRNHQLQLAAAAVLIERLKLYENRNNVAEHKSIVTALIALTKDAKTSETDPGTPLEVSKFIVDQVARVKVVNIAEFDWQNSQLRRGWWKGVDASGIDFWKSDMREMGLREANFSRAQMKEVQLDNSNLSGANLRDSNLSNASLLGANLVGASLSGANLKGALYNSETRFPENFQPSAHDMQHKDE